MRFRSWIVIGVLLLAGCRSVPPASDEVGDREKLARLYATKGGAYLARGNFKAALADLQKALRLDPDNAVAHATLALLYEDLDMPEKAAGHYEAALRLAPENPQILNNYGRFLCKQGRYDEGLAHLSRAGDDKLYDKRWTALVNAGECAQRAGRLQAAETWLRQALRLNPEAPEALAAMARLMAEQGKWLSARAFLQRYEAVAQPSRKMLELGYRIERALGDATAAQAYRDKLRRLFSGNHPTAD